MSLAFASAGSEKSTAVTRAPSRAIETASKPMCDCRCMIRFPARSSERTASAIAARSGAVRESQPPSSRSTSYIGSPAPWTEASSSQWRRLRPTSLMRAR